MAGQKPSPSATHNKGLPSPHESLDMTASAAQIKEVIPDEATLCSLFIEQMNQEPGWACYPETGGFDILVAHESGRQIGVQAKLQLNAKVADQILPKHYDYTYEHPSPDHRLVIVRNITESSEGIARLLDEVGIAVWAPNIEQHYISATREHGWRANFYIHSKMCDDARCAKPPQHIPHWKAALFDWNPAKRIELPPIVPKVAAGVPSPTSITPWKLAAVRVLARLRLQGFITTKQIASEGCSPSMWTQRWLQRSEMRGQWLETDRLPPIDKQHPDLYELALKNMQERLAAGSLAL